MENMESTPLVSIGIPIFNGEKYLAEALDSVLSQNYKNIEIIICDNASTDKTADICQAYLQRDSRIRYFRHPFNVLCTKNFSSTLQYAKGKYFTWLACDDFISSKDYIALTVNHLENHPDTIICGSAFTTFYAEDPNTSHLVKFENLLEGTNWDVGRLRFFTFPITTDILTYSMYRTEILKKTPYLEKSPYKHGNYFPGVILLADLCQHGKVVCLPEAMRAYRCNLDSLSYQTSYSSQVVFNTKLAFLKIALSLPIKLRDKFIVVSKCLANFFSFNIRNTSITGEIKVLRAEIAMLRKVCAERLSLLEAQTKQLNKFLK